MIVVEARVLDATHLELAKPIGAPPGGRVLVSLAETGDAEAERSDWLAASSNSLSGAYGDAEPDYTLEMVRQRNPEFTG